MRAVRGMSQASVNATRTMHHRSFASKSSAATRSAVSVLHPAPHARESPVPVVLLSSKWHTAESFQARSALPSLLTENGYTVGLVDLPGYGKAQSLPAAWTLDDIVRDLRATMAKGVTAPPVVIAQGGAGVLMQKFLEDFPLAGLIMLAPLPPSPASTLRRWLGLSEDETISVDDISAFLRACASMPESVRQMLLARARASDEAVEQCFSDAGAQCHIDVAAAGGDSSAPQHYCGVDAMAHVLAGLAASPVNLEPQPIPMALFALHPGADAMEPYLAGDLSGAGAAAKHADAIVSWEETLATIKLHELHKTEGCVHFVPSALAKGAKHSVGHCMTYASPAEVQELNAGILSWIAARW